MGPENVGMRWERESSATDSVSDVVAVKGRLKDCISFWKDVIRPPASIISTIESGYVLPLSQNPPHMFVLTTSQPPRTHPLYRRVYLSSVPQVV